MLKLKQSMLKEIKENSLQIEVVKKQKKSSIDRMEMMNATFEEEAKRKACELHIWVVGWAEKGKPTKRCQESQNNNKGIKYSICLMDVEEKKASLSKSRALKDDKINLDDDLTPTQVAHCKENMPHMLDTRKEGKWGAYRDNEVTITEKRATWRRMALCMDYMELQWLSTDRC